MLTQACNKIESSMMSSASNNSPARKTNADNHRTPTASLSPPAAKRPRSGASLSPLNLTPKTNVSQPMPSNEGSLAKRKSPERRPSSTSTSSLSAASPSAQAGQAAVSAKTAASQAATAAAAAHLYGLTSLPGLPKPQHAAPCTDPLCRDPSCPTTAMRQATAAMMGYPPAAAAALPPFLGLPGLPPPAAAAQAQAAQPAFVCNWMSSGEFCGRRFNSSEDLHGHLRTHTSTAAAAAASATVTASKTASPPAAASASSKTPPVNRQPSPAIPAASADLAALQAAQAQALYGPAAAAAAAHQAHQSSALAALQAQAAKTAAASSLTAAGQLPPTTSVITSAADSMTAMVAASALAARYHPYVRPPALSALSAGPAHPHPLGLPVPPTAALPPHLAAAYAGLPNPYAMPMLYPLP